METRSDVRVCPECQGELTFVCSWTVRGRWGYDEVRTYECAAHGPVFVRPVIATAGEAGQGVEGSPDDGDRDALIPAPRRPMPTLDCDAIALPEPDPPRTA
jgi:hypothetical protein